MNRLDKRRIATPWVVGLTVIATLPLALLALRILALAGPASGGPIALGDWLNQSFNLLWIGPEDRRAAVTIMLLPLAALLTAFTRLTLGLRVLGFRAILIAIGFQEIGFLASLLLLLVVAGTAIAVRPLMRRIGMPLYARVAAILCLVAATLLAGLLGGAWLGSGTLWSMAFFPVVILAMLAESVADTVARDNLAMAVWRMVVTLALAGVIAGLSQITALREIALATPELVLTQLVAIVLLSEFGDWRLFEDFRPGSEREPDGQPVVVVRNRFGEAPIIQRGSAVPRRYRRAALQPLIDGLRAKGCAVRIVEGDARLPARLRSIARETRTPPVVLNFSGGVQGAGRRTWVPTCCEMLGLRYTGPSAQAPALWDDRCAQIDLLQRAGLATPQRLSPAEARQRLTGANAAVVVRPRFEADRNGRRVSSPRALERELDKVRSYAGEPLIEADAGGRRVSALVLDTRIGPRQEPVLLERCKAGWCEARPIAASTRHALSEAARLAHAALACGEIARVDLEVGAAGDITVWQVDALELPTGKSALVAAGRSFGVPLQALGYLLAENLARESGTRCSDGEIDGAHTALYNDTGETIEESRHAIFLPNTP